MDSLTNKLELYVYTTPTWQRQGLLKVGHCKVGTHEKRIKAQFNASNPEKSITLWVKELPEGKTDHHIHAQLVKNGIENKEDGAGTEWFYATREDVEKAFNEVVHGIRSDAFSLREEQKEAVDKARKWFLKEYSKEVIDSATHKNRFLLNAKMRFGKCFTGIHIAKSIKAKHTIIVTYKPKVIDEWMSAVNDHIDFKDFTGVRAKAVNRHSGEIYLKNDGSFSGKINKNIVCCISAQDLDITEDDKKIKERLQNILKIKWDLLIFDEVHFGGSTSRVKEIIMKNLKPKCRLDLSGTPFRLMERYDFSSEQVFTYSYLDEMEKKRKEEETDPELKKEPVYRQMPTLDISTMEITDEDIADQRLKFKTDNIDFSLNKLFEVRKGKFLHERAVDHFIDNLAKKGHEARSISVYGTLGDNLNMPPKRQRRKRHSIFWLSRINSIKCLIKKLQVHPTFSRYELINAVGGKSDKDDLKDEEIVKGKNDIIKRITKVNSSQIDKLGTITLTCKKFLTGVTIKEWDSILILNDIQSAESYYQAIFRVQSAWYENGEIIKPKGFVFDFSLSRCLRVHYELSASISDDKDRHEGSTSQDLLGETINQVCDDFNIKAFYEGNLQHEEVTAQKIFAVMNSSESKISLSRKITSNAILDFESLALLEDNPHLFDILKKIKGYRSGDINGSIPDLVQIGVEAKKLRTGEDSEKEEKDKEDFVEKEKDKEKRIRKKWYATQIKRLSICMSDFIYMTKFREYQISDVIKTKDSYFFETVTGINKSDFEELCDKGFINREILNEIVRRFRMQEDSSVKTEEFILEFLKNQQAS